MKLLDYFSLTRGAAPYDVLGLGEVMLRLSASDRERINQGSIFEKRIGGSEFNVLSGVSVLGGRCGLVTKLPDSELGTFVIGQVRSCGVTDEFIVRDPAKGARLGVYYYEAGASPRKSTVIYDRAASSMCGMTLSDIPDKAFSSARVFHTSGITLALSPGCRQLVGETMRRFREQGALISFDVNYRANQWSEEEARDTIRGILPYVDLFFVSEESSRRMFGKTGTLEEIMKSYCREYGVRMVATTQRTAKSPSQHDFGSVIYSAEEDRFYSGEPYRDIEVVDRVGSGDSYVGGVLSALCEGLSFGEAVERGNACAAMKTTIMGDLPAFDRNDIRRIIDQHLRPDGQSEMNR